MALTSQFYTIKAAFAENVKTWGLSRDSHGTTFSSQVSVVMLVNDDAVS